MYNFLYNINYIDFFREIKIIFILNKKNKIYINSI